MKILIMMLMTLTPISVLANCIPTPQMFTGTHYKPDPPEMINISTGMSIRGRILSSKDCRPVAGARIEHWQAASDGFYTDRLRAWFRANDDGSYRFNTEWPGAPTPHIHFIVSAKGYKTLTTQWIGDQRITELVYDIALEPNDE